jgi:hypothetical protein
VYFTRPSWTPSPTYPYLRPVEESYVPAAVLQSSASAPLPHVALGRQAKLACAAVALMDNFADKSTTHATLCCVFICVYCSRPHEQRSPFSVACYLHVLHEAFMESAHIGVYCSRPHEQSSPSVLRANCMFCTRPSRRWSILASTAVVLMNNLAIQYCVLAACIARGLHGKGPYWRLLRSPS